MTIPKTLVDLDPWLRPHGEEILRRTAYVERKSKELLHGQSLDDFALGHLYFGLHKHNNGWIFREWAPNATKVVLVGEATNWQELPDFELKKSTHGNWELSLPLAALKHGEHYKLHVYWQGGDGFRIPSYATYVTQDETTHDFDAIVWAPDTEYTWSSPFEPSNKPPLIYEAHVGMSSEKPEVAQYSCFTEHVLPRVKQAGYNTVQLMAIQEHPYYGSFGYHVSNFFAASSRFGTPTDLKKLIDTAHSLGLRVILDLVHSHAVKNEAEGLGRFDGTLTQYFYPGARGEHPEWDSRLFDYGKNEVQHFLLSNCRFWIDEYHVDGFRFDGITSMLYTHHGLKQNFTSYADYFGHDTVDVDALTYLTLANQLIHSINPNALTIAEEMSGYPGIGNKLGAGFDYRLSMGTPDLWIKTLKEQRDEDWSLGTLYHELTTHRPEEKVISYAESHDQALVGDKTLIFRLVDKEIYEHMQLDDDNLVIARGIALHKMIRLLTASLNGGGYLNFMGNEFGHPEWIDFPREGNNWSYQYAKRQWSLVDNPTLKYHQLADFDRAMIELVQLLSEPPHHEHIDQDAHVLSFERNGYLFVFNFSPDQSHVNYTLPATEGNYSIVLSSDDARFGGYDRLNTALHYNAVAGQLQLYLPARTACVLRQI